jgi:hypothetical protein
MPAETDEEVLEFELNVEARLDAADERIAPAYEAGVWRKLRGAHGIGDLECHCGGDCAACASVGALEERKGRWVGMMCSYTQTQEVAGGCRWLRKRRCSKAEGTGKTDCEGTMWVCISAFCTKSRRSKGS